MDEKERSDLLVSETVDDLRQVFLVDHVFPKEFVADEPPKKAKSALRSLGSWICRGLGFVSDSGKAG